MQRMQNKMLVPVDRNMAADPSIPAENIQCFHPFDSDNGLRLDCRAPALSRRGGWLLACFFWWVQYEA